MTVIKPSSPGLSAPQGGGRPVLLAFLPMTALMITSSVLAGIWEDPALASLPYAARVVCARRRRSRTRCSLFSPPQIPYLTEFLRA